MARNATYRGANLQYVAAPTSLTTLTDVTVSSAANLDRLQYSASAGKWVDVAALTTPQIEDASANHQYVFAVSELAADRTVTLPLLTGNDIFTFNAFPATLTNKTLTSPVLNTGVSGSAVLDEDNMGTNSATQLATQQSIKAYVDAQVATEDTLAELNDTTISGPASNDVLQYSGSAWVDRTYAEAGIASITGSETLTNKTLTSPTINGGALTALTDLDMTSGDKTILDTIGANTLTIGAADTTTVFPGSLTVSGTTTTVDSTNTVIADKLITLNDGGGATSGTGVGIEVEENSSATGYLKTAADRAGWEIKAPSTAGIVTIDPSANSNTIAFGGSGKTFTISETATIDQDLATTANVTHANITATGNVTLGNAASDTVTVTGTIQGASPLVFEGGTANGYETTLAITDPTADRTWTLPDATDTFVGKATTDSLSNKTLASPVITTGDINTPDIDGGTVDAITSLTIANNVDVGSYTVRASGFLADGLTAGQVVYTGTDGVLSSEAALAYNAGTNTLTATNIAGTLSTAAQASVTSLGTLTALTVDNVAINGATIGHTGDTDLITLASGIVTVAGEISATTLDIGGTNVTSTAAELNLVDGSSANSVVNSKAVIYGSSGELAGTLSTAAQTNVTSVGTLTDLTVSGTSTTIGTVTSGVWEGTTVAVAQGGTGATSLSNLIALTTMTTGNYVATVTGGTGITSTGGTTGEGVAHSLSVDAAQTQITSVGTLASLRTSGNTGLGGAAALGPATRIYPNTAIGSYLNGAVFLDFSNSATTQITAGGDSLFGADFKSFAVTGDSGTRTVVDGATVYIDGPPTAGSNAAITNPWSLWVDSGNARFDGNVDLNSTGTLLNVGASGNDWDTNLLALSNSNSGAGNMIKVGNTSADANSSAIVYVVSDGTSAGDAYGRFRAGTHESVWGLDNSADKGAIGQSATLGANDVLRFTIATPPVVTYNAAHPTGTFDYVCSTCQAHGGTPFNCHGEEAVWHDDVAAMAPVLQWADDPGNPELLRHMADLGIFDLQQSGNEIVPWVGLAPVRAHVFTWSAMRQMYRKIEGLESQLKALKAA